MAFQELPDGYREQNGCHNCGHVFRQRQYDEGDTYFCNIENNRPPCGSMAMGGEHDAFDAVQACFSAENWATQEDVETARANYRKSIEAWDGWSIPREVSSHGICPKHVVFGA
jgi:hypothetical protein